MRRVLVLGAVGVLAACSSGGVNTSQDPDKAAAAVLKQDDLPDGFAAQTSSDSSSSSDSESGEASAECFRKATGKDPNVLKNERTGKASSSFRKGSGLDEQRVEASVELYPDGALLSDQLRAFEQPDAQTCLQDAFKGRTSSVKDFRFATHALNGIGDGGRTFLVEATVTTRAGVDVAVSTEINLVRVGRAGLTAVVTTLEGDPDHELALTALRAMAARVT